MARLILGVTGSVAAIRTPALYAQLNATGHDVRVVATRSSLYFFDTALLGLAQGENAEVTTNGPLFRDSDEWPGTRYHRGDEVLHIEFRKWADLFVVAPLDANTLAKFALGMSDNFLTCIYRAWDFSKPLILAPAMNTLMWDSPVTLGHLRQLIEHRTTEPLPAGWTLEQAPAIYAQYVPKIILIPPQSKRLACGDVGVGAMAEVTQIAEVVRHWSLQEQPSADP
ncbi:MAG TPA: flavoprotein [Isosphaeraceae bacterium]|nr:flavoprotein [Isosphaeraceae bacterium]